MLTNTEEKKTIQKVKKRIENLPDIPDSVKEKFYRAIQKRNIGFEMIMEVMVELQRTGKWNLPAHKTRRREEEIPQFKGTREALKKLGVNLRK